MEDRPKYILIGIAIGVVIGMVVFFLLMNLRIIGSFGGREFLRPDNFTNFTRNLSRGMV